MATHTWGNLTSRAVCLAIGAWLAVTLSEGLRPAVNWTPEVKPRPVRISVRAAAKPAPVAAPAAVAPREVLPIKMDKAPPKKPKLPKPVLTPTVPVDITAPVQAVAPPPAVELPPAPPQVLPTLSQPAIAPPIAQPMPTLPTIPGSEVPPAPPDSAQVNTYPEVPGGPVLVLELTVNDQGIVIDSRILVPSSNGLADFALVMGIKGQRWRDLTPPLYPGEQRRLEIRIPFEDEKNRAPADILP